MACGGCGGGGKAVRIERTGSGPSLVASARPKVRQPLRPVKKQTTAIRVIRPANHLDKRM